jgi:hypothetical protein
VQTGLWLTFRANLMRQDLWIGAVGAWALEARLFMRRSIEGLGLVPPGIVVEHQDVGTDRIVVSGRLALVEADCPDCGTLSRSCHSRYVRTLADLPVGGRTMAILLTVRRFRCTTPGCHRTTFSEDVGGQIGRRHGRRSARCDQVVHAVAIALGGRTVSRQPPG